MDLPNYITTTFPYCETRQLSSRTLAVYLDERQHSRRGFLQALAAAGGALVFPSPRSSIGHVEIAGFVVVAKPKPGTRSPLAKETEALSLLDSQIKNRDGNIQQVVVTANNAPNGIPVYCFDDISHAGKIDGTPKADFALFSQNDPMCFISHKADSGAKAFQQYSGITEKADGSCIGSISGDQELVEFLLSLQSLHSSIVANKQRYFRPVQSETLMCKSIFGPAYLPSAPKGIDNVHLIGQGDPILTQYENRYYTLTFSHHAALNGHVNDFVHGEYTPIFSARYTQGRTFTVADQVYRDVRVLIAPMVLIGKKAIEI